MLAQTATLQPILSRKPYRRASENVAATSALMGLKAGRIASASERVQADLL